jgi:uncharacterized protein
MESCQALSNVRKHSVTFDQAATVFLDVFALTVYDIENEDRWFTLGFDSNGQLLAVAHTYEPAGESTFRVRIISARKATRRERHSYEEEPR